MAKNKKNRNKKNRNDEAIATEDETCSGTSPTNITGFNDTPSDVGGAVQSLVIAAPSSDVYNADTSIPPTHPLDPPETFAPKEAESTISSPDTFHSAYGSPRSDSTTSQVFDYAPTGLEFWPTSMIQEKPLDIVKEDRPLDVLEALESIAKKKEIFLQSVAAEVSVQTAFFQPGTRGGFVHDSPAHQQGIRAQPNTPVGAGQTAYAASDDSGQRSQAGTRAQASTPAGAGQAESGGSGRRPGDAGGNCQNEANGIPKCRDRDPDQDDDEQEGGPSSSRSVASSLAVPNSGRGGRTTRTSQSPTVNSRTLLPRMFLPFNDFEGIETITFGKAVVVPASTPEEAFERDVNTANFNCPPPPAIVVTEPALSEDGDESDMSTIVPDDHIVGGAPQHVTDGDGANTQDISSCVVHPSDAEHNPQQPQAKKKSKKKKKTAKKTNQGDDVVAVVTEDMAAVDLEPRPKPNVRMLLAKDTPAVIGDPPKTKYGTTAFISPGEGVYWRPGNWKWDREPTPMIYVDGATVERVTGINPAQDVGPTSLSETAQGKQKASTGLNPEADIFRPSPSDSISLAGDFASRISPKEFVELHPCAKLVHSAAEAYMLPSHAALGSPIIRNGDNDSIISFLQGKHVPVDVKWNYRPKADPNRDKPEDMYPGSFDRYHTSHLFDLKDTDLKSRSFMVGDMQLHAHNTNFGTFYTTTDGILVAPPGNSPLFSQKLSPIMKKTPLAFGGGDPDKYIGIPISPRLVTHQPTIHVLGHDSNPYNFQHGAWIELMPSPESHLNEQVLTALQKMTEPWHKRQEILADRKWMEPNIPTGFTERAKHQQGIQTSGGVLNASSTSDLEKPVSLTHPVTRKTVEGTMIKPGLRGGGDTVIPSYVMNTVNLDPKADSPATRHEAAAYGCQGYSHLKGILLKPEQDIFKQRPYVTLTDGAFEPIIAGQTLRRIANNKNKGARAIQLFGGYFAPVASTKNWSTTPRYTCSVCNSFYHGLKDCPIVYIKGGQESCLHCGKESHILAECPYPCQFQIKRTIVHSILLYVGTLHFRMSVLAHEFEHEIINEEKYLQLRSQMTKDTLQGEAMHAFATIGCPLCESSSHEGTLIEMIKSCADRFRQRGGVEEWKLAPKEWMYDTRKCPLYHTLYNKNFKHVEFYAYNPLKIVAIDALNRDILRAQGWHIKTPLPVNDEHLVTKQHGRPQRLPDVKNATAVLAGEVEYSADWVRLSGENDFFTWW